MTEEQITSDIIKLREDVAGMRQDIRAAFKRIDEQRSLTESVHDLALSVREQSGEIKRLVNQQDAMRTDLDELKSKPGKRWEAIVAAGITGVVGFLVAWFTMGG